MQLLIFQCSGTWRRSVSGQNRTRLQEKLQDLQNVQEICIDMSSREWDTVSPRRAIHFAFKVVSTCLQHLRNV